MFALYSEVHWLKMTLVGAMRHGYLRYQLVCLNTEALSTQNAKIYFVYVDVLQNVHFTTVCDEFHYYIPY